MNNTVYMYLKSPKPTRKIRLKAKDYVSGSSRISFLTRSWAGVWYVRGRCSRGPASQSCCPIAEVQAIPPASATCPSPSLRARGEGEGQMAVEGRAASWVQHPPQPPASKLHAWSHLHPLTPLPLTIQTPEPQCSSVLHDWANTVLHQNKSPVSPLQLLWIARKA